MTDLLGIILIITALHIQTRIHVWFKDQERQ